VTDPRRGEVWWGEIEALGRRPFLVMTRTAAIPVLNSVLAAPVTRTIRNIPTELLLGPGDGMPTECAASFDNLRVVPKSYLVDDFEYIGTTERRGIDEARAIDEPIFATLPDHWRRVEKLLVSGDKVAVWLTFGGTPTSNGQSFEIDLCDIFEIRDGKIQSLRMYSDWSALTEKLAP